MDTISHAVGGYLLGNLLLCPIPICILLAFFGLLPDLIGWLEKITKHDPDAWNWYVWAHSMNILWVIPSYSLHCILDKYTHGKGKRWWIKSERLWAEILYWCILTIAFIFIIL